jgi:peptidyl-prolyl cis-trans isomerase SurA
MNSIDTDSTTKSTASSASAPASKQGGGKTGLYAVIAILVIVVIGAVAYFGGFIGGTKGGDTGTTTATDITAGAIVAVVNAKEITGGELEEMLQGVRASVSPEALLTVSEEELKQNVLQDLINMHLLLEEADKKGIVVTKDEVQAEFTKFEQSAGGKDALLTELGKVNLTEERFRVNIENELRVQRLLEAETTMNTVSVSDEEINAIYEEARAMAPEGEEFPALTEVSDAARMQLMQQKSGEIINAYIETLRAGATIEVKI